MGVACYLGAWSKFLRDCPGIIFRKVATMGVDLEVDGVHY